MGKVRPGDFSNLPHFTLLLCCYQVMHGCIGTRVHEIVSVWVHACYEIMHGCIGTWVHEIVSMWVHAWVSGYMDTQAQRHISVWVHG